MNPRRTLGAAVLAVSLPQPIFAQVYPDFQSTTVNDYADVLDPSNEATLTTRLLELREERGVEMTVLTLQSQNDYAPGQSMERFATGLFNHWGIGDASRNDGIMVMVLVDDRAMRIELGAGYPVAWDRVAQDVIGDHFLPAFRAEDYQTGIMQGTAAVMEEIAVPFHIGQGAPEKDDDASPWIIVVVFLLVIMSNGWRYLTDLFVRFRRCPQCGQRGLRQTRQVTLKPTRSANGYGKLRVQCRHCAYDKESNYFIPELKAKSSGGFGGGSSRGGGASGRW